MKRDVVARALELIRNTPQLRSRLEHEPEAVLMPFAKEHDKHYLCVSAVMNAENKNREAVATFCSGTISLLALSGVLRGLDGVELSLGAARKRLIRLGVLPHAIARAANLRPEDLHTEMDTTREPVPGIVCTLYQQWPTP